MTVKLRWAPAELGSCVHALHILDGGESLIPSELNDALEPFLGQLKVSAHRAAGNLSDLWPRLIPLACCHEAPSTVVQELRVDEESTDLATVLRSALQAMQRVCTSMAALRDRERPLREQWEARGPGLLRTLERVTGPLDISQVTVHLVHPVSGGGGAAHPQHASVHLEALLTNAVNQPPETVRLAWLLAQLRPPTAALPGSAEASPALQLLPPVLWAAEQVELGTFDLPAVERACRAWLPHDAIDLVAPLVDEWRERGFAGP